MKKLINILYYLLLIALAVFFIVVGNWFFTNVAIPFCEEYEASRLSHNVNEYMRELNSTKWNDAISSAADSLENNFQSKEEVEQIVKDYLQRGIITQKMSGVGDETKFTLSSVLEEDGVVKDVQTIGTVSFISDTEFKSQLEKGFAKTLTKIWPFSMASGFKPNHFSEHQFNFDFMKANGVYTIEAPDSYKVTVNGKDVGEEYIVETGIKLSGLESLYDDHPGIITMSRYEVPQLIGDTSIVVFDVEGNEFVADKMKTGIQYAMPCTDEEMSEIRDFFNSGFATAYVNFWGTKWVDTTYPKLVEYVMMKSPMQQEMYEYTLDAATWIHTTKIDINSLELKSAKTLGDDVYVMVIAANTTAYADGKNPVTEDSEKTIILTHNDSGELKAICKA